MRTRRTSPSLEGQGAACTDDREIPEVEEEGGCALDGTKIGEMSHGAEVEMYQSMALEVDTVEYYRYVRIGS